MPPPHARKFYTPNEVREILGVSRSTVYRWIDEGILHAIPLHEGPGAPLRIPVLWFGEFLVTRNLLAGKR